MRTETLNIETLKKNCTMIHYFGLGFIQVKLGESKRIHFYNSDLPAIVSDEEIHNHRYDFKSTVIAGVFEQELYIVSMGDTHVLEQESCKAGVIPETSSTAVSMKKISEQKFTAGSSYTMDHNIFHKVKADFAITLVERGPTVKEFADVIRLKGAEKICPFSKQIPEEELWQIVEEMIFSLNYQR